MAYMAISTKNIVENNDILSDKVKEKYREIKKYLTSEWKNAEKQHSLLEISGCLDKFSSVILQINRLYYHQINLIKNNSFIFMLPVIGSVRSGFAVHLNEACYDFEALLLHTRSALDRLTLFVTSTNNKNNP